RLPVSKSLVAELSESPNVRVLSYGRLLQIIRRFLGSGSDPSSPDAIQAINSYDGPRFVVLPALIYEDNLWRGQAEIQDSSTATRVAVVVTGRIPSSIMKDTAYRLIADLAVGLQEHFRTNGPGQSYASRAPSARLRSLDAAASFEAGLNAFDALAFSRAEQSFAKARQQDTRNPLPAAWLSRVQQSLRKSD